MNKAVLISIRPKWCELIASGKKTIEVRKTRPKIKTPFKCYIYCTNNGDTLYSVNGKVQPCNSFEINLKVNSRVSELNGYVIGEFVCDEIIEDRHGENALLFENKGWIPFDVQKKYAPKQILYGWHISELKVYKKPKNLFEFMKPCDPDTDGVPLCLQCKRLSENYGCGDAILRPPQSWMYVEELP